MKFRITLNLKQIKMNILDKIIIDKRREVILKKSIIPVSQLEASVFFGKQTISLSQKLKESNSGIIADI